MAPQPLQPQTRKQPDLGDPAACTLLGPRFDLAELLKLPPHGGVFPGKPGHCKVQEAFPWESRPSAVGGQKRESASPECAPPFSVADSSKKDFGASVPLLPPSPLPQAESPRAVPLADSACRGLSPCSRGSSKIGLLPWWAGSICGVWSPRGTQVLVLVAWISLAQHASLLAGHRRDQCGSPAAALL